MRPIKKTIYTLNVNNYSENITSITYPFIEDYAEKIGADFVVIKGRKFPDWPVVYEKLQIYELGRENDWSIYVDSDAIIHPDMIDLTVHLDKDTVLHYGNDLAGNRWKYDKYFLRDGRNISSCNWFTIASDWCLDLWRPLDDLTLAQALVNISPVVAEKLQKIDKQHLIDDYVLSRNIAKYGLKFTTCKDLLAKLDPKNSGNDNYFFHEYLLSEDEKISYMKDRLKKWGLVEWYLDVDSFAVKCMEL